MRILLVSHRYLPHSKGGVETFTDTLARGLTQLGYCTAILARDCLGLDSPFSWQRIESKGQTVYWLRHQLSAARSFRDSWRDPRLLAPLQEIFAAFAPEIVHLNHPDGWGVLPLELARHHNLLSGATLHDYKWLCPRGQMLQPSGERCETAEEMRCARCVHAQLDGGPARTLARLLAPSDLLHWAARNGSAGRPADSAPSRIARQRLRIRNIALMESLRACDVVASPSRFVADRYQKEGLQRHVEIIKNGLLLPDQQSRDQTVWPFGCAPQRVDAGRPLTVGFFGNAHQSKGLALLREALVALPKGSVLLHVHGSGGDLPGPFIKHHGAYRRDQIPALLQGIDVVAIPSIWDENQPMVALEARACRKALLVSDLGGLPELVEPGVDGWIVPGSDPESWAERLATLAARPQLCSEAGLKSTPPYDAESMAAAYLRAYGASDLGSRVDASPTC